MLDYSLKSKEQKEYYNKTAEQYDQWHVDPASAKIVDTWNFNNLKQFLGQKKINNCLDLGCGTGRLSNKLLSMADQVYGVDQSEEVLKIAIKKYPALKLTCAEVVNLPYEDNFFDLVIINGSLHHFFAVEQTLRQVYRVLKPNGLLVLLGEPNQRFMKLYNPFFYLWGINRVLNKLFSQNKGEELIEPEAEQYLPSILKKQIIQAGFDIQEYYTYDYLARSENKIWLKVYNNYLNFEHQYLAKIFKNLGMAIQCLAIKK